MMTYMQARWMDNSTGRFISSDPIKDGYNWYSYTAGNPISYVDPTGLYYDGELINKESDKTSYYTEDLGIVRIDSNGAAFTQDNRSGYGIRWKEIGNPATTGSSGFSFGSGYSNNFKFGPGGFTGGSSGGSGGSSSSGSSSGSSSYGYSSSSGNSSGQTNSQVSQEEMKLSAEQYAKMVQELLMQFEMYDQKDQIDKESLRREIELNNYVKGQMGADEYQRYYIHQRKKYDGVIADEDLRDYDIEDVIFASRAHEVDKIFDHVMKSTADSLGKTILGPASELGIEIHRFATNERYREDTLNFLARGDLDPDVVPTKLGIYLLVLLGIPGVDAPFDFRDMLGSLYHGDWGMALLNMIGLIPAYGLISNLKYLKHADEMMLMAKYGDDLKYVDEGLDVIAEGTKSYDELLLEVDDVLKQINPTGDNKNCIGCVIAIDIYLKEGKILSVEPFDAGRKTSLLQNLYKSKFSTGRTNLSAIVEELGKRKGDTIGIIAASNPEKGISHVFNVTMIKGQVLFIDGQKGIKFNRVINNTAYDSISKRYNKFLFLPTN